MDTFIESKPGDDQAFYREVSSTTKKLLLVVISFKRISLSFTAVTQPSAKKINTNTNTIWEMLNLSL